MKVLELYLIGYSLLRLVISIQTSFHSFARLKRPEVVLGQLLDIGWVTFRHTTLLAKLEVRHITQSGWILATKKLNHLTISLTVGMSGQNFKNDAIYLWYLRKVKFMDLDT